MTGRLRLRCYIALLALCVLPLVACGPTPGDPAAAPPVEPTPSPNLTESLVVPSSLSGTVDVQDTDLAPCPPTGSSMLLKFSANIMVEYGEARIEHMLQNGALGLVLTGSEGPARIESAGGAPIPYEMTGTMGECKFEGQGEMIPSASGYCQDGIVYLTILENWGPYEGQMTCEDKVVPFNIPAMGVMRHTGADGQGEVFPLDKGFSDEGAGYTSIRPFQAGSGEHVWTLFYDWTGPTAPQ